jgi:hypothetical protein
MDYVTPGLFDQGEPVARERARTELLAHAFADVAGGYFDRQKDYEDAIAAARDRKENAKRTRLVAVAAGVVVALLGLLVATQSALFGGLVLLVGVGAALAGVWYARREVEAAEEQISSQRANIRENEPDGEVKFVSQVTVPFYLVPYGSKHMVFDGLGSAPETRLDLATLDGDALVSRWEDLSEVHAEYQDHVAGEDIVSPEYAAEFAGDVEAHRSLERPIADGIDDMTAVVDDMEVQEISVNVHANDRQSRSISSLASDGHLREGSDLPSVEVSQSLSECEAVVRDIRGVEQKAVSGDMLDAARGHRENVAGIAETTLDRLESNRQAVVEHGEQYGDALGERVARHVCERCLAEETDRVIEELSLVNTVFSSNTSFGVALDDDDLNDAETASGDSFKRSIRTELGEFLPEPEQEFARAFNRLPDRGADGGNCSRHGEVTTTAVSESGVVFGEVWRSLYYTFRDPILESAGQLEEEAENVRQHKEQRKMDLADYEQARDSYELQFKTMQSEYETAEQLEENLPGRVR